jgi:hypothetical protein
VGHISRSPEGSERAFSNSVSIFEAGRRVFFQSKTLLPTYDIFDEARYFEPAEQTQLWDCDGVKVAVAICEDLWTFSSGSSKRRYRRDLSDDYQRLGAQLVLSLSSSPYEWEKRLVREDTHARIAKKLGVPLIYVNQVGATDEILFDGGSFVLDGAGNRASQLPYFKESLEWIETDRLAGAQIEPECVRVAGEHHEKFAGTGYPRKRAGRLEEDAENGIHLYSRIVTIADIYSALLMKRVYKDAYEPQDAIKTMAETAANDYDPELFHNFLKTVVNSLNTYQGTMSGGKGRILYFDDEGKLRETQKPKVA